MSANGSTVFSLLSGCPRSKVNCRRETHVDTVLDVGLELNPPLWVDRQVEGCRNDPYEDNARTLHAADNVEQPQTGTPCFSHLANIRICGTIGRRSVTNSSIRARHCSSDLRKPCVSTRIAQSPCSSPQIISFAMNIVGLS